MATVTDMLISETRIGPDLAVEVVSKSNSATDVKDKIEEYFRAGVRLVWLVYPTQKLIDVYESPTTVRVLRREDELTGGDVLPGFRLPLTELFRADPASVSGHRVAS